MTRDGVAGTLGETVRRNQFVLATEGAEALHSGWLCSTCAVKVRVSFATEILARSDI